MTHERRRLLWLSLLALGACSSAESPGSTAGNGGSTADGGMAFGNATLPLAVVADVDLPGPPTRFDYPEIDAANGRLVIAHMNNASVLFVKITDGSVLKELANIPTPRGVAVADDVGLTFVTSTPGTLVLIDNATLTEKKRVATGSAPDGVAWDPAHKIVGVSDQGDGAISLIAGSGSGTRTQVPLGSETGNVVYDAARALFWITVVAASPPNKLVAVEPVAAKVTTSIDLPGCDGAHGLRLHPDGESAFIACEGNDMLARVDLGGAHAVSLGATGSGPDVLSIDPGLGWLYVAAESGDLTVFDIGKPGVALVGHDHPGSNAHSVAADPSTHRVFFPLLAGPKGTPVLRIMSPKE